MVAPVWLLLQVTVYGAVPPLTLLTVALPFDCPVLAPVELVDAVIGLG